MNWIGRGGSLSVRVSGRCGPLPRWFVAVLVFWCGCKAECTSSLEERGASSGGGDDASGGWGAGECVAHDEQRTGLDCSQLAGGRLDCGSGVAPPARQWCEVSEALFTPGTSAAFHDCLAAIGALFDDVCDEPEASLRVAECLNRVRDESCDNPEAEAICSEAELRCAEPDRESFDRSGCARDSRTLNSRGRSAYAECVARVIGILECSSIHSHCAAQVVGP